MPVGASWDAFSFVFAPQKGATCEVVELLEKNLENLGKVCVRSQLADNFDSPGDGAAGGVGFALRTILGSKSRSGAELVLDKLKFARTEITGRLPIFNTHFTLKFLIFSSF